MFYLNIENWFLCINEEVSIKSQWVYRQSSFIIHPVNIVIWTIFNNSIISHFQFQLNFNFFFSSIVKFWVKKMPLVIGQWYVIKEFLLKFLIQTNSRFYNENKKKSSSKIKTRIWIFFSKFQILTDFLILPF